MPSYNKAILMGNLTADPELKKTPNGISVCTFHLAVSRKTSKPTEKTVCDFFEFVAWRHHAEYLCRYFSKGNAIHVEAKAQTQTYNDRSGNKRTKVFFVVDEITPAERKYKAQGAQQNEFIPTASYMGNSDDFEDLAESDELPF